MDKQKQQEMLEMYENLKPRKDSPFHDLLYARLWRETPQVDSEMKFELNLALLELVSQGKVMIGTSGTDELTFQYAQAN